MPPRKRKREDGEKRVSVSVRMLKRNLDALDAHIEKNKAEFTSRNHAINLAVLLLLKNVKVHD